MIAVDKPRPPAVIGLAVLVVALLAQLPLSLDAFDNRPYAARILANRLVLRALPAWQAAFEQRGCPARLADLLPFSDPYDRIDPWGRDFRFHCWVSASGSVHASAWSAGRDGRFGTDDDIGSEP